MDATTVYGAGLIDRGRPWFVAGSWVSLVVLLLAAVLLAARRASGALDRPLDPFSLAVLAVLASSAAALVRTVPRTMSAERSSDWFDWCRMVAPSIALCVVGGVIMLPGTGLAGAALFWAIVLGEEIWTWRRRSTARPQTFQRAPALKEDDETPSPPVAVVKDAVTSMEESIWQRTTRGRHADGTETVQAWIRCGFEPGQRVVNSHLAFCPPLAGSLAIEHRQTSGPAARIKAAQLLPQGVRLELKLAAPSDRPVEVAIQCTVTQRLASAQGA